MKHRFVPGKREGSPVLLMLHGTGGNEEDLLGVGQAISPDSALLGVRGQELEQGMPRFFRRLAMGVFDEENLLFRTAELNDYLQEAAEQYGVDRTNIVAVGYSNGANIAASLLFHHANSLRGAVLFHPMVPRRGVDLPSLQAVPVFIGAGSNDPLCPPQETEELIGLLDGAGASVTPFWHQEGHRLTHDEVRRAAAWYEQNFQ
ncbi:alpha/beta hydrolase [Paenibacillus senegalensis]|uniref:alpha/beta hydrolase n=1 Tax=Paenibacillus senegalensis TaxID=1465766 RepID=UPI0004746058|nr:alpha/beta hydrolase [Paenibacillus senegalensis]